MSYDGPLGNTLQLLLQQVRERERNVIWHFLWCNVRDVCYNDMNSLGKCAYTLYATTRHMYCLWISHDLHVYSSRKRKNVRSIIMPAFWMTTTQDSCHVWRKKKHSKLLNNGGTAIKSNVAFLIGITLVHNHIKIYTKEKICQLNHVFNKGHIQSRETKEVEWNGIQKITITFTEEYKLAKNKVFWKSF